MSKDQDTVPAPADHEAKISVHLSELELALARVGELVGKIQYSIDAIKVSQLTVEHRTHTISEAKRNDRRWLVDIERRVRELEGEETAAE